MEKENLTYAARHFWIEPEANDKKVRRYFDYDAENALNVNMNGFCSISEAERNANRSYSTLTQGPVHTLIRSKKIAFPEKGRLELLAMLQEDGFTLLYRDYSPPFRSGPSSFLLDRTVWTGSKGVIALVATSAENPEKDNAENLCFTSMDTELLERYSAWWDAQAFDSVKGKISSAKISGIFQGTHGATIRQFSEPVGWPVDFRNYEPTVPSFYNKVKDELSSATPSGRLVLLDGPPGTGKTFILRGLVHDLAKKVEFVYLPASMVHEMDGPAMISLLDREEQLSDLDKPLPKVLIIEDADECLISRAADNISSIRNLLNFCDGFLGALLDIRIIATTNSGHIGKTDKIDGALLRPGRLLARSTIGLFPPALATERLFQLTGKADIKIDKNMSLAEIYALASENGWKPPTVE